MTLAGARHLFAVGAGLLVVGGCFVNDVAEDTTQAGGSSTVAQGGDGAGAASSGTGAGSSVGGADVSASSSSSGGASSAGGAGGQPAGVGGSGGSDPSRCGDGVVEGEEQCDEPVAWCVGCAIVCDAPDEALNVGNGHCYRFVRDADKGFDDAQSDCAAWRAGAHLVSITTDLEQAFVQDHVTQLITPFENTYLGGRKVGGAWTWVSGEPWGFTNFYGSEGNNANEQCLGMYTTPGPGPWHDFTCSPPEAYVCEWSPP